MGVRTARSISGVAVDAPPTAALPTTAALPATALPATGAPADGYGCAAALQYLSAHAAPGFILECPGDALGHEAMTCVDVAGVCPGQRVIAVADPCPAAYMNEASNSYRLVGLSDAPIDPYGGC